jgi:pimeloyl-ACP methyl ester carboxylesterase
VLTGVHDVIVPPAKAAVLAEELHAPPPVLLPECGHLSHEEAPQELVTCLAQFVGAAFASPQQGL